jgi:hypothetical protein
MNLMTFVSGLHVLATGAMCAKYTVGKKAFFCVTQRSRALTAPRAAAGGIARAGALLMPMANMASQYNTVVSY